MLASAALTYLNRFAVACGRNVVVATNNDSAYATALALAAAGCAVTRARLRARRSSHGGSRPTVRDHGPAGPSVAGGDRLARSTPPPSARAASKAGSPATSIVTSAGWTPSVHLTSHLGSSRSIDARIGAFVPGGFAAGQFGAGALTGSYATAEAIAQGSAAGAQAAALSDAEPTTDTVAPLHLDEGVAHDLPALAVPRPRKDLRRLPERRDDIRYRPRPSRRLSSVEHLKRYTTLGMGTDQGKTSNIHALALMARARSQSIEARARRPSVRPIRRSRSAFSPGASGTHSGRCAGRRCTTGTCATAPKCSTVGLWKRPLFYRSARAAMSARPTSPRCSCVRERGRPGRRLHPGQDRGQGPDAADLPRPGLRQ